MREFDYKGLDFIDLQAVVAVFEDLSVSRAADRLDVTQSTLSHRLEKVRKVLGDPLFVRKGRGITATGYTASRIADMRVALSIARSLYEAPDFDPNQLTGSFTIAATDYERTLFVHNFCNEILRRAPRLTINLAWEKYDNTAALRRNDFDLAISPFIGKASDSDIRSEVLFQDRSACFYDPSEGDGPTSLEKFLSRRHVSVIFSEKDESFVDRTLQKLGKRRDIAIRVPSLSDVPGVLKGSNMIATLPERCSSTLLDDFASVAPPFEYPPITFGMFWHEKTESSPHLNWLRDQLTLHVRRRLGGEK